MPIVCGLKALDMLGIYKRRIVSTQHRGFQPELGGGGVAALHVTVEEAEGLLQAGLDEDVMAWF
jgi:hypothetical protein